MQITYYGHSCFAVEAAGRTLLFDPFITPNPLAKAIDIKTIRADYILISHGHSDHCADAVEIARQTGATIVSNFEVTQWLAKAGAPNIHPMNHGGSWRLDFGRIPAGDGGEARYGEALAQDRRILEERPIDRVERIEVPNGSVVRMTLKRT